MEDMTLRLNEFKQQQRQLEDLFGVKIDPSLIKVPSNDSNR